MITLIIMFIVITWLTYRKTKDRDASIQKAAVLTFFWMMGIGVIGFFILRPYTKTEEVIFKKACLKPTNKKECYEIRESGDTARMGMEFSRMDNILQGDSTYVRIHQIDYDHRRPSWITMFAFPITLAPTRLSEDLYLSKEDWKTYQDWVTE